MTGQDTEEDRSSGGGMGGVDRWLAMLTVAAGAVGLLAGGGPSVVRSVQSDPRPRAPRSHKPTAQGPPPDPGYAKGPLQALQRPIHGLKDLTPPAPPTAEAQTKADGPHTTRTPQILD